MCACVRARVCLCARRNYSPATYLNNASGASL